MSKREPIAVRGLCSGPVELPGKLIIDSLSEKDRAKAQAEKLRVQQEAEGGNVQE